MKRILLILMVIAVIVGGLILVRHRKAQLNDIPIPYSPAAVFQVHEITHGKLPVTESYSGTIIAEQTVDIVPQIQGQIFSISCSEGDTFLKNDILVRIDDREILQQIRTIEADIRRIKSEFKLNHASYVRNKNLIEQSIISQQSMDEIEAALNQSKHHLESIESQLDVARTKLSYTLFKAPFDGVVLRQNQEINDMAMPGKSILQIENSEKGYKVIVNIPARHVTKLSKGSGARLISGQKEINTVISKIYPSADPASHLGIAEIHLPMRQFGLPSGAAIRVEITVDEPEGLIAPIFAVLHQKDSDIVYQLKHDNTVDPVRIHIIGWPTDRVVFSANLNKGDKVVVADESRLLSLHPGQEIRPVPEEHP